MKEEKEHIKEELKRIQHLLAGILLKRTPTVKEVAKIMGCSDNVISKLYPEKKKKKNDK